MNLMNLEDFFGLGEGCEAFRLLLDMQSSARRREILISGPSDPLKTYLLLAFARKNGKRICLLVPDELRMRELDKELQRYQLRTVFFRRRQMNLISTLATSREDEFERLGTLSKIRKGEFDICVISASAVLPKLMPLRLWEFYTRRLQVGDLSDVTEICAYLIEAGYERSALAESPGQFSQRGDLVDIVLPEEISCPATERMGVRISFDGDRIDAIKRYDQTQRSVDMLREAVIYPAREVLIPDAHIAARDADRYVSLAYPDPGCVWDYADSKDFIVATYDFPTALVRMEGYLRDFYEKHKTLLLKGKISPGFEQSLFTEDFVTQRLRKTGFCCHFSQLGTGYRAFSADHTLTVRSREPMSYRGREALLVQLLKERRQRGERTCFMVEDPERREKISAWLAAEGLTADFAPLEIDEGFDYLSAGVLFLGVRQLFAPVRKKIGMRRKSRPIEWFGDLKTGDLIVHEIHGIGRYGGIATIATDSVRRDYIRIEYDREDTLYIPTENLDLIQKYIGSGDSEPRLSRLGGQEWSRMKDRARTSVRMLATDLVKLYSQRVSITGFRFSPDTVWQREFEDSFDYCDTADQATSTQEIKADMESERVMDRILCGDVGFGKTEVAFRAIFKCVMDGKQAAFLVPTTVLAQQHYENLTKRLQDFPVKVKLLSRFVPEEEIRKTRQELVQGTTDVVIGTHRILSDDISFQSLGLLIVDEEQRFGVDHKEKIKSKHPQVDVLTLSATPIPRTLHMALSGIRDISVLEQAPPERVPISTVVMHYDEQIVSEAMLREIGRGGQVFYLYNNTARINQKAKEIERMLPGVRIAVAHGKMHERELENIISFFVRGEADILVCTTIIESGIDMPNVNTIIVENADRLGLSQLHQLRGRVGRSGRQAYSYITYKKDKVVSETAQKRLAAIRDYTELGSGFKIAMRDLEVRGAGDLLGARQHGNINAVGYDLYCKMLQEEIRSQTGEVSEPKYQASVELKINAYLSTQYVPDESQRMDLYRKIALIVDTPSRMDVQDEIADRYGEIPEEIIALTDISYIRAYAGKCGIERVWERKGSIVLTFRKDARPDMESWFFVMELPQYKGMLSFHAQAVPYIVLKNGAIPIIKAPGRIRALFTEIEKIAHPNITSK